MNLSDKMDNWLAVAVKNGDSAMIAVAEHLQGVKDDDQIDPVDQARELVSAAQAFIKTFGDPNLNTAERHREECGGMWGEHEDYPVEEWACEVECDATRLGYWEWVQAQIEMEESEGNEFCERCNRAFDSCTCEDLGFKRGGA